MGGKKRRCILCGIVENSDKSPLGPHPDGIGPACTRVGDCERRRGPPTRELEVRSPDNSYRDAFLRLRARVYQLQRIPAGAITGDEQNEETSLIIALGAMKDLSGCFDPDDMIRDDIPPQRFAP